MVELFGKVVKEIFFRLRKVLKSPSFRSGLLLTFGLTFVYVHYGYHEVHRYFEFFENGVFDNLLHLRHRMDGPGKTSEEVVIVDVDEKSLAKLGQWPWPRRVMADLLYKLDEYEVKISGFDIVFAEPDRTSFKRVLADELQDKPELAKKLQEQRGWDNDVVFGEAIANTDAVLGFVFIMDKDLVSSTTGTVPYPEYNPQSIQFGDFAPKFIAKAVQPVGNISLISDESLSEGFFNADPDRSGTVREVPLFLRYKNLIYPSLIFEMVRIANEIDVEDVKVQTDETGLISGLQLKNLEVPLNAAGEILLNFRGPAHTFKYFSVVDVLEGKVDPKELKDKYVLIGSSAQGLKDLRASPFDVTPGTELLATALDNILQEDPFSFSVPEQTFFTVFMILFGGYSLAFVLSFSNANTCAFTGVGIFLIVFLADYFVFFQNNKVLYIGYSFFSLLLIYMTVVLGNFFYEGRDKRFLKKAFSLYLSKELVEQIVKDPEILTLEGEERKLSVMFSDIRSFSTFSEKLSAAELSRFLNEYLTAMSEIAMEGKGYIDKFIGDAVMAFWGAPVDDAEHACNSVHVGLVMLAKLDEMRGKWVEQGLPAIEIGIGINSGPVCVGNMGSQRQFNYTVMGDNVNLASRLEGLNKAYGTNFLIAQNTYEMVKDRFACRFIDRVRVKGKTIPVKIYEPLIEGELTEERQKEVDNYHKAMNLYCNGDFEDAEKVLKQLMESSHEKLYEVYMQRIQQFKKQPPPEHWDGVYTHTTK